MIWAWIISRPVWAKIALAVAPLVLLMLLAAWIKARVDASAQHNQQVGAAAQREASQAETIHKVQEANDAREEIKQAGPAGDAVRYDQCLRTARTPANCRRFAVPGGSPDKR